MLNACPCQEFELPSTWIKEVPKKGFLEVHYHTDHLSEETIKSRSKRGDNFDVRVKWFKRTLCYTDGMAICPCSMSEYTSALLQRSCTILPFASSTRSCDLHNDTSVCFHLHYAQSFLLSWIGMVLEDDEYQGIKREDMPAHRNWTVARSFHAMHACVQTPEQT